MVKHVSLKNPGIIKNHVNNSLISGSVLTVITIIAANADNEPLYIDHVKIQGWFFNSSTTTNLDGLVALVKRREAVNPETSLVNTHTGQDAIDLIDMKSLAAPVGISGQIQPMGQYHLSNKSLMIKLDNTDDLVLVAEDRLGDLNLSHFYSFAQSRHVKVRSRRTTK